MFSENYEISIPQEAQNLDQHEEWFMVDFGAHTEKFKIHEYDRIYRIPGLYEEVVYERLQCSSPEVICSMLKATLDGEDYPSTKLRALDFGAGNGIVGEVLKREIDIEHLVGVDIYPEAQEATKRDRPGVYNDYYVMDLTNLTQKEENRIKRGRFNLFVTVAALGFNDICTQAFVNAFNLIESNAWIAFNIRDKFLKDNGSGFKRTLEAMMLDNLHVFRKKNYCHRISVNGERLYYYGVVGRKLKNVRLHNVCYT